MYIYIYIYLHIYIYIYIDIDTGWVKLKIANFVSLAWQVATFIPPGISSRPAAVLTFLHNNEKRQQILPFTESSLILNGSIKS